MRRDAGLVLVNALVIVLAISAVAAALLTLAERGRARLAQSADTRQLVLYLDAAERLIPRLLEADWEEDGLDHLGEFWADDSYAVPIGRGAAEARLSDMQGLWNVNLLAGTAADTYRAEFARLLAALELPQSLLQAVEQFLSEGGPQPPTDYLARTVPVLPPGGPIRTVDALRQVAGLTEAQFATLSGAVTALPVEGTPLNVNTAPATVLMAILPGLGAQDAARLLQDRAREPFTSALDFRIRATRILGDEPVEALPPGRIDVRSQNFGAVVTVRLGESALRRALHLVRDHEADGATRVRLSYGLPGSGDAP